MDGFRLSLFDTFFTFHTRPDSIDRFVDVFAAGVLEFKAIALFSLLFGVGVGMQADRLGLRRGLVARFLARRFLVLSGIALGHILLVWNGDILMLYAACGLLTLPFLRLPAWALIGLGVSAIVLPINVPFSELPGELALRAHAAQATLVYANGSWLDIAAFRWHEALVFIRPLLLSIVPRTFGLMLIGVAAWRFGVARDPARHRRWLWTMAFAGTVLGAPMTWESVSMRSTGQHTAIPAWLTVVDASVSLAVAYAAAMLLWLSRPRTGVVATSLAAAGQMALTNYLTQSVVLGFIFYGYGLGLFGKLGSAVVALMCVLIYAAQLVVSRVWLRHYEYGPAEWLWRSLTYGRTQRMRRDRSRERSVRWQDR